MEKHQSEKLSHYAISSITVVWTVCFLLTSGISLVIGEALMDTHWSIANADSWTFALFGLAIAIPMSGLFTALILRKYFSRIKWNHIMLVTLGWGIAAMILWLALSFWMSSD